MYFLSDSLLCYDIYYLECCTFTICLLCYDTFFLNVVLTLTFICYVMICTFWVCTFLTVNLCYDMYFFWGLYNYYLYVMLRYVLFECCFTINIILYCYVTVYTFLSVVPLLFIYYTTICTFWVLFYYSHLFVLLCYGIYIFECCTCNIYLLCYDMYFLECCTFNIFCYVRIIRYVHFECCSFNIYF
jgi:hypothetical protein